MMTARLALIALVAALPTAAAATDPTDLLGGDDPSWLDNGLVWGLGLGGVGVAVAVGVLYYLGVGGLRHIDRENVLEHPMRQSLFTTVREAPGVHLRELASRHGTAVTNTQWHLRKLELAGLLKTQKVQGRRLYYPTEGGVAMKEQALQNAATQNPNAQRILDFVAAHSGCNQRTLAEALGMNPGTVRWHLRKMEAAGIVRAVPEGTMTRYFLLKRPDRPPRPTRIAVEAARDAEMDAPEGEASADPPVEVGERPWQ